ncbi:MAG: PAS domain-containing protein, partial [Deltaproteobacteria bacterium]|nr:PAS domain-containing protein [Deltaproteobacteria bacterium]
MLDESKTKKQLIEELKELRRKLSEMEELGSERTPPKKQSKKLLHDLGERIKELKCMYGVSESIRTRNTQEEIFQDVANLIPSGWHYPDITRGKVVFEGKEYVSESFEETKWKQSSNIIISGDTRGSVEVYYLKECPELDEGPFMMEERTLLNEMVRNISEAIEYRRVEEALRDSEERFALAMRGANDGLWDWNLQTNEVYFSPRWKSMLGYAEDELENIFDTWERLVEPEDLIGAKRSVEDYLAGRSPRYEAEFRMRHKQGHWVHILARAFATKNESDGKLVRLVGTHVDITERKWTEEELKKLDKLQSVGVLAGGIAHDFNNLLTAIIGSIDLAKMWLDPKHKSYGILALAEKSIMKGSELSNRLITFSSGGAPKKKVVALSALIKESAELALSGSDAYLKVHLPDGRWPVEADEGQINQVINNLTRNGAQAMQAMPGGGTVTVSAENVKILPQDLIPLKEGKYVKVTVEDHGEGISEDIQGKVFDPYFTTKGMGSTKGTGLGLAIVHSIVKEHGGHVGFDSKAGKGTTFYFYLPASDKEPTAKEEAREVKVELPEGKARVLILEDDETVYVVLSGLLEMLGYEVVVAKEGGGAIRIYKEAMGDKNPFDIVIVDLVIRGGMGGKEAMEELLKVDPRITAIVSSGYTR